MERIDDEASVALVEVCVHSCWQTTVHPFQSWVLVDRRTSQDSQEAADDDGVVVDAVGPT